MKLMLIIAACALAATITCNPSKLEGNSDDKLGKQNSTQVNSSKATSPAATPQSEEFCIDRLAEIRIISIKKGTASAIPEYEEILSDGCDYTEVRMAYGLALTGSDRYREAAEQYRSVIKRDPKHWAAHWTLAQILILELGEFNEGLLQTNRAKELDDLGDIGHIYDYYLGRAFEGLGKPGEAVTHYREYEKRQSQINTNDEKLVDTRNRIAKIEVGPEQ